MKVRYSEITLYDTPSCEAGKARIVNMDKKDFFLWPMEPVQEIAPPDFLLVATSTGLKNPLAKKSRCVLESQLVVWTKKRIFGNSNFSSKPLAKM